VKQSERAPATASSTRHDRRARRLLAIPMAIGLLVATIGTAVAAPTTVPSPVDAAPPPGAAGFLEGIDVSHWQGTIDWQKVAASGKRFAIMKATQDTDFVDDKYAINRSRAAAAGVVTTAYHFAAPDTRPNDAISEADHFVNTAKLAAGDIVPALDLEQSGGLTTTQLTAWTKAFLDRVKSRLDVTPMVYTSPAFWRKYLADTTTIADSGYKILWIAHWGVSAPTVAAKNWGGQGWTFWQYSNCGNVPGISGCVDLDRFNGTDLTGALYNPGFRLSLATAKLGAKQGATASFTVRIARSTFFDGVAFSVDGLPPGAKATFTPGSTTGSTATVTVTSSKYVPVTPTGTYPLTINGVGGDITRTTTASLVVTDGIGPVTATPGAQLYAGTVLGSTTAPVRTTWTAADPSGIASYQVQRQTNGGSWSTIYSSTTARLVNHQLSVSATYRYRVRATDKAGNVGSYTLGPSIRPVLTQQNSTAVKYAGSWGSTSTSSASGGSMKFATNTGPSATYTFTGAGIAWVAYRGPSRGAASVYVDGVYAMGVNLYSSANKAKAIVFAMSWPTSGTHTISVINRGTAGHPRIDVDAFVRLTRS
jgi:GH25 family lysozyme M1 (1,4-beta-N-acetylmuramidase)